jgi:hypothetical protein
MRNSDSKASRGTVVFQKCLVTGEDASVAYVDVVYT